jgi:hypothetical protein
MPVVLCREEGAAESSAGIFGDIAHATIDRHPTRNIFTWVLQCLGFAGLIKGKTLLIDATTLEGKAALRSIERRDPGECYNGFLTKLAQVAGIETPTPADLAKLDRKRKKKRSNEHWEHLYDADLADRQDGGFCPFPNCL